MKKFKLLYIILLVTYIAPVNSFPQDLLPSDTEKRISRAVNKFAGGENQILYKQDSAENIFFSVVRVETIIAFGCIRKAYSVGTEFFEYFIITDTLCRVLHLEVFNYQAPRGHEIMSRAWLRQFIGYNGENSLDLGQDIDSISGATVSSRSITKDVKEAVGEIKKQFRSVKPELQKFI